MTETQEVKKYYAYSFYQFRFVPATGYLKWDKVMTTPDSTCYEIWSDILRCFNLVDSDKTECWVSQVNKWCKFCKIYITNNPSSIRNHELGQRHKDNVAKRVAAMRKENAAKEKEQKEAVCAFEQIEAKAKRSYKKDVAKFEEPREPHALDDQGCKWVTQEEAFVSPHFLSKSGHKGPTIYEQALVSFTVHTVENKASHKSQNGSASVPVVSSSLNHMRSVKAALSSLAVGKRKGPNEKQKVISSLKKKKAASTRSKPALLTIMANAQATIVLGFEW